MLCLKTDLSNMFAIFAMCVGIPPPGNNIKTKVTRFVVHFACGFHDDDHRLGTINRNRRRYTSHDSTRWERCFGNTKLDGGFSYVRLVR